MNAVMILAVIALSGWKGETVSFFRDVTNGTADARLVAPAFAALPEGWTAKAGVLRGVRYATEPYGDEYRVAADRVEWDGTTNLAAGASCRAVGSVTVPPGAKAGDYAFSFAGEKVTMHVADRVLPPPSEWKYHMDMWHNPFSIARLTGTKPWSDEHFEAMRPFMALTAAWGQKGIVVSISDYPWCHQCYDGYTTMIRHIKNPKTGKWTFDYAVFDKWVQFNFDTGNGKYISCYSLCPWGYAVYWEDPTGHPNRLEAKPGTKEFEEYWTPFLADFTRHLKEKGWLEKVQLCFDERGAEDVRKITAFLDRVAPWFCVHAATDGDPAKFDDLRTKAFTQALWEITPEFLRGCHARRARGERAGLTYVCCKPERPNNFFWSDPDDNFWIQVYPIAHGLAGSTRWTVDSWPRDPMNDATYYNWPSSDTYFIYPDASPSIRYLLILNGVQNGEKWRILYDEQKERRAELDALAERYDIRQALGKKDGDFAGLIADTLNVLNHEGDSGLSCGTTKSHTHEDEHSEGFRVAHRVRQTRRLSK